MYTSMPRAELVGTARFVDAKNRLCCEVTFGKVAEQPDEPLLQRSDAFSASLYRFSADSQPPNGASHHVRPMIRAPACCLSSCFGVAPCIRCWLCSRRGAWCNLVCCCGPGRSQSGGGDQSLGLSMVCYPAQRKAPPATAARAPHGIFCPDMPPADRVLQTGVMPAP